MTSDLPRKPLALALMAGLFSAGWFAHSVSSAANSCEEDRRVRLGGYRFISPLLDVELPEGFSVRHEPIPFKFKVKAFVDDRIASGAAKGVAVYFRDLMDGPWFGIGEKVKYNPASMMKVPVMIAWLKRAETSPAILTQRLAFDAKGYPGGPQATAPARTLEDGRSYSVEELLHFMIAYSDNRAMWVLFNGLRAEELGAVLDGMDVTNDPSEEGNQLTVHGYSGFFRILFNAAYLNEEMSEKALALLSAQDFPQGIAAGVPRGTVVAAKFGEDVREDEVQLHEFGIVYHPKGPYVLGIMTRGRDLARQAEVIRELSALIYAEVASGPEVARPVPR